MISSVLSILSSYIQNSRSEICHNYTEGKYVGNVTMCPECEKYCPYWRLDKSCSLSKVAYVFDNYGTVVFSIVMSIWGRFSKNTLTNGNTRNAKYTIFDKSLYVIIVNFIDSCCISGAVDTKTSSNCLAMGLVKVRGR